MVGGFMTDWGEWGPSRRPCPPENRNCQFISFLPGMWGKMRTVVAGRGGGANVTRTHYLSRRCRGFTLMEILVALAVLTVGFSIIIGLLGQSIGLRTMSRDTRIAGEVAEEQLLAVRQSPDSWDWQAPRIAEGETVELALKEEAAGLETLAPPATHVPVERVDAREREYYNRFSCAAYAALPKAADGSVIAGAPYYEVVVVVRWRESGKAKSFTLTSAVPRYEVEGAA